MLCFKDNADNIVEIKPSRSIDGGGGELPPDSGNVCWRHGLGWHATACMGWNYLASCWTWQQPYVQKADGGTITNTAGDGCDIPLVNNLQVGLMSPGDKNKLDGYPEHLGT